MVAVPMALIAWIGVMLVKERTVEARNNWKGVLEDRLASVDTLLSAEVSRLEEQFDRLLLETPATPGALQSLPDFQPLVRYAFLLGSKGRLEFPVVAQNGSSKDAAFLRRTESLWESGVKFDRSSFVEQPAPALAQNDIAAVSNSGKGQSVWSFSKTGEGRLNVNNSQGTFQMQTMPVAVTSGWHVWYHGNGPRLIYWQKRDDGRVLGLELEMAAFYSVLINRLSASDVPAGLGAMSLESVQGESALHQWGSMAAIKEPVAATRVCSPPLGLWRLSYRAASGEAPTVDHVPILLGAGGAGIALAGLAFLLHRESKREMVEAQRRVSFVNQVSHELKTPLTNIRLYTELAQQKAEVADSDGVIRHLSVVEMETTRLSRLIHHVLTFARQQRDQLTIHPRMAVLDEVTQRTLGVWKPALESKGVVVTATFEAPHAFAFDPDAVEQILGNLLSNIEKYAATGQAARVSTSQTAGDSLLVVEDAGPGINIKDQERIFAPFVRLRDDLAEGTSGTGIGLSIARHLAELHGGSLELEQRNSPGARFVLRLPRKSDEDPHS